MGGFYYLTVDEVETDGNQIRLIEAKHGRGVLPSSGDIKDALIKMALFANLERVAAGGAVYDPVPTLKLTAGKPFDPDALSRRRRLFWDALVNQEAARNGFVVRRESRR